MLLRFYATILFIATLVSSIGIFFSIGRTGNNDAVGDLLIALIGTLVVVGCLMALSWYASWRFLERLSLYSAITLIALLVLTFIAHSQGGFIGENGVCRMLCNENLRQIVLDSLQSTKSPAKCVTPSSRHGCYYHNLLHNYECDVPDFANVAMLDLVVPSQSGDARDYPDPQHTRFIDANNLTSSTIHKLLAIGGCAEDNFRYSTPVKRQFRATIRWSGCGALTLWIVTIGALVCLALREKRKTPAT